MRKIKKFDIPIMMFHAKLKSRGIIEMRVTLKAASGIRG